MFESGRVVSAGAPAGGLFEGTPGLGAPGLDCLADEADELDLDFLANGKLTRRGDRF
jgi:hypothetical protein